MNKSYHYWRSPALGIDMPMAVYGHFGTPMLMFPTAAADFEEYERMGLIGAIAHHVEAGRVKLYCVNAINNMSWFNDGIHPAERARRQALYDRYIHEEVVPFIHNNCNGMVGICTVGASMGAYHAVNEQLKHPWVFRYSIGMSGIYEISRYFDGYYDDNCYFNNPPDYVGGMTDHNALEQLRACSINIVVGQGPWEHVDWSERIADALWSKAVPCNFDKWGFDVSHDWPWWKVEMNHYIPKLFG
ncbi:MAG: esterase [Armatimonadetes bacterium]|nr:esterase [Armatimonadota bacterium]